MKKVLEINTQTGEQVIREIPDDGIIYPAVDISQSIVDNTAKELIHKYSPAEKRLELIESGNHELQAAYGAWRADVLVRAEQIKTAIASQIFCDIKVGKINGDGSWPEPPKG